MKKEAIVRTFTSPELGRVAIRLSETFWCLVDRAAEAKGLSWQAYVEGVLRGEPDAQNYTALVRDAAASDLLAAIDTYKERLARARKEVGRELINKLLDDLVEA
ncbi:hypothetical protein [Cupriavidus campinensis]|uniref:Ribbon-helix-helix domain-containing protein n=1 Tax=Cupriavidus campinensis TaxID=151783 RepID=A0ABY3ESQ3_9BURK|nr:hypothetical protein [Cupriavidus campinensis]TSP14005.1 hypothetical protein FGG12_05910 [Cupriavidus campinensis]